MSLKFLDCLDSDLMGAERQRELDIGRDTAAGLGRSAVEAIERGYYVFGNAQKVDWSREVAAAKRSTVSIPPDAPLPVRDATNFAETRIQVANETTLAAGLRLVQAGMRPLALNFANGIHPGGGFLHGARAQEEALCRCSALYTTLAGDAMYREHAKRSRPDSTDWAIYSPDVPVFRTDDGREIAQPWLLSFITCAAPYAPSIGQPEASALLRLRIQRVLAIARAYGHTALVLGAWGCGAFGNDPVRTAADFREALEHTFNGAFGDIIFAITDWSPERRRLGPFREAFSARTA